MPSARTERVPQKREVPARELAFRVALGQRIRKLREGQYSQEALADKIHIIRTHMSTIELGRADVKISTLLKIAEAFDMTVEELLQGLHAEATLGTRTRE